jgi:hypothetical protein
LHDVRGKPRVSFCLKALRDLEREGKLRLPPPVLNIVQHWRVRRHGQAVAKPKEVPQEVGQIRNLQLRLVDPQDGEQMRTWNELMVREHPQGQRRLVGRQLRYLVGSVRMAGWERWGSAHRPCIWKPGTGGLAGMRSNVKRRRGGW